MTPDRAAVLDDLAVEIHSARPQERFWVWLVREDQIIAAIRAANPNATATAIRDDLLNVGRAISARLSALEACQGNR